ncbi:type I phosphomannose isomerase catalytic subunit [Mucilaginibacter lutimaris]|uniref:Phosphohexomutase n=1 Tax=Mucilaginibacter lutimaris TaxID=931629 RepID=A0ABW2ZEM5_9SPHI
MEDITYYPLRFPPIYQYRLWGGRKLEHLLTEKLPDGPIGEAWLLSDRDEHASVVADGTLKGKTLLQLLRQDEKGIMGKFADRFDRFPLLLKFLDCNDVLSVQVHPSDEQKQYIPKGEHGKTEGWVVLETQDDSLIYAGLTVGTTPQSLKKSLDKHNVAEHLHSFKPKNGDSIFIKAGTIHTLKGVVVFEVQENSDITFRLSDWNRTDKKTGKPRPLQVEQALACIDYDQINIGPVEPSPSQPPVVLSSDYFTVWKHSEKEAFTVGGADEPRVLVCVSGNGQIESNENCQIKKGNVFLLPAQMGACQIIPNGLIEILEVGIPS